MHIQFKSAKNLAFYLSHPCSMTTNAKGKQAVKNADKILIGANENGVALFGSRGTQSYERIVPTTEFTLFRSGAIGIESSKLIGVIRTFGDNPISIEVVPNKTNLNTEEKPSNRVVVSSGKSRININEVVDATEIPRNTVNVNNSKSFKFSLKLLKEMLQSVKPPLSEDTKLANMRCLQLKVNNQNISTSTVDGRRLSIAKTSLTENLNDELVALIPVRVVDQILSLVAEQDLCTVSVNDTAMSIIIGSLKFQTSLMDVKFPDLTLALPKQTLGYAVVQAKPLYEVLERAKIAVDASSTGDSNIPPRIKLNFTKNNVIECEAVKTNITITEEEFIAEKIELNGTESILTGFDYNYLQQAINATKSPVLCLTLAESFHGNPNDPALIMVSPVDPKKQFELLSLILPHRF